MSLACMDSCHERSLKEVSTSLAAPRAKLMRSASPGDMVLVSRMSARRMLSSILNHSAGHSATGVWVWMSSTI